MLVLLGAALIALVAAVTFVAMFREGPADSAGSSSDAEDCEGGRSDRAAGHDHPTVSDGGHDD